MSISNNLKQAIKQRNINNIQEELRAKIPLDPTLTKGFAESLAYCLENGINVYDLDDGRNLPIENTADSFEIIVGMIQTNFSKEKLNALSKIADVVYGDINKSNNVIVKDNQQLTNEIRKQREQGDSGKKSGRMIMAAILIISAAIVAFGVGRSCSHNHVKETPDNENDISVIEEKEENNGIGENIDE